MPPLPTLKILTWVSDEGSKKERMLSFLKGVEAVDKFRTEGLKHHSKLKNRWMCFDIMGTGDKKQLTQFILDLKLWKAKESSMTPEVGFVYIITHSLKLLVHSYALG